MTKYYTRAKNNEKVCKFKVDFYLSFQEIIEIICTRLAFDSELKKNIFKLNKNKTKELIKNILTLDGLAFKKDNWEEYKEENEIEEIQRMAKILIEKHFSELK